MRLLNTTTLELEEYYGEVPPYAILSHRWGQEEVTFRDFEFERENIREGFSKIRSTCEEALRRGLDYVWIDTCCIDKTSSAELTESINSMYKWYEQAEECYVYMADVSQLEADPKTDEFRKSSWFTRGWTLQELIAPSKVLFYNSAWQLFGEKTDIECFLERITGIDGNLLCGRTKLDDYSTAQKFSWASGSIFNVHMPMLYGEGDNAFRRLQEEIIKISDDQTLFAWGDERPFKPILAPSPSCFNGLEDLRCIYPTNDTRSGHNLANSGLSIKMMLIPWTVGVYLAPLSAGRPKRPSRTAQDSIRGYDRFCIFLRQTEYEGHLIRVSVDDQDSIMVDGDFIAHIRHDLKISGRQVFLRQMVNSEQSRDPSCGFEFRFGRVKLFRNGARPDKDEIGGSGIWDTNRSWVKAPVGNFLTMACLKLNGLIHDNALWFLYLGFDLDFAPVCLITSKTESGAGFTKINLSWLLSEVDLGEDRDTAVAFRGHVSAPAELKSNRLGLRISFRLELSSSLGSTVWRVSFAQLETERVAGSPYPPNRLEFESPRPAPPPPVVVTINELPAPDVPAPDANGSILRYTSRTPSPRRVTSPSPSIDQSVNSSPRVLKKLFRRNKSDGLDVEELERTHTGLREPYREIVPPGKTNRIYRKIGQGVERSKTREETVEKSIVEIELGETTFTPSW